MISKFAPNCSFPRLARDAGLYLCAGLMLHLSVEAALADPTVPMSIEDAVAAADRSAFKVDPSSLYNHAPDGTVTIGNLSVEAENIFSGVEAATEDETRLPETDTYEDLYVHRDSRLSELQNGSGLFSGTGAFKAETQANDVLRSAINLPSIASESFLVPSREALFDPVELRSKFANCQVEYNVTTEAVDWSSSQIETCEQISIDLTPLNGERTYLGPNDSYRTWIDNEGRHWCERDGLRQEVENINLCSLLNIMHRIPTEANSVHNCSTMDIGCFEIELALTRPSGYEEDGTPKFPDGRQDFLLDFADYDSFCDAFTSPYSSLSACSMWMTAPLQIQSDEDIVWDRSGFKAIEPKFVWPSRVDMCPEAETATERCYNHYPTQRVCNSEGDDCRTQELDYHDDTYYPRKSIRIRMPEDQVFSREVADPNYSLVRYEGQYLWVNVWEFTAAKIWHRDGAWSTGDEAATARLRLRDFVEVFTATGTYSGDGNHVLRHNGSDLGSPAAQIGLPQLLDVDIRTHFFELKRTVGLSSASATIRVTFANDLFTKWKINQDRLDEHREIDAQPQCTVDGIVAELRLEA